MTDYFKHAVGWYIKGGDYRQAALELFDKKELEKAVCKYEIEEHEKLINERERILKKQLEYCKEHFPIGTLIRSDDGTDRCLNIVVGEPYIGEHDYHWPQFVSNWRFGNHRTVLVNTVRVSFNKVIGKSIVCLENLLHYLQKDKNDPFYREVFVTLDGYHDSENKYRNSNLDDLGSRITRCKNELNELNANYNMYCDYNPEAFTQETIDEIVKKYKK